MRNLQKKKYQIIKEAEEVSEVLINTSRNFFRRFFNKSLFLIIVLLFMNTINTTPSSSLEGTLLHPTEEQLYVANLKTNMKELLVSEVENYIKELAPDSKLNAEYLVNTCIEYNTDIIFVLSQALLESHFGTRGKATQTNSVWNVGTYDDGQILYRYETQDQSLEPYLKLINEKYLINITPQGDTIYKDLEHLVRDRGYTNYKGLRFASARGYENGMRKLMIEIDMNTRINFYQEIIKLSDYKIIAYFRPSIEKEEKYLFALN